MATQSVILFAETARYAQAASQPEFATGVTTQRAVAPLGLEVRQELSNPVIRVIFTRDPGGLVASEVILPHVNLFEAAFDQVGGLPESYATTTLSGTSTFEEKDQPEPFGRVFSASPKHTTIDSFEVSIDPKKLRRWNPPLQLEAWELDEDDD